jgi:rubrerythrin
MEISERELAERAAAVDERHRDGMATMASDIAELHAETRRFRRDFLRTAGIGAGALVIGGTVLPFTRLLPTPAAAQAPVAAALTDVDLAVFAESVELAAVEAYRAAATTGKLQPAVAQVGTTFAGHHAEHAKAFAAYAGDKATGKANPALLQAITGQLHAAPDQKAILQIAFDIENAAAATYLFALGAMKDAAALQLTATILPVEAQHATVLGQAIGLSADKILPTLQTQTAKIDPAKFPVAT